jgi:hypothetical protein
MIPVLIAIIAACHSEYCTLSSEAIRAGQAGVAAGLDCSCEMVMPLLPGNQDMPREQPLVSAPATKLGHFTKGR